MCKLSLAPILYYGRARSGNSTGDEKLHTAQVVDGLGRQNETRQYVASTEYISVTKTFDALQRVASVSNPYQTDTESAEYTATAYDGVDRPSTVTTADTSQTSYSYSGNTATVTDPAGNKRTTTADAFGRTTAVTEDPSGLAYATSYIYDVLDDLTSVAQGTLAARSFTYDSLKRLMKSINPESGAVCYGTVSQGVCSESYDKNGNLTSKTDARSAVTTFTYDALNRLKGKSYSDSVTPWVAYTYDTAGYSNSIGRLTIVQAGVIYHDILAYDSLGHVASDELAIAPSTALQPMDITSSQAFNFSYKYKRSGALWQETYPSGRMITVDSFDGAGRPTSVGPDGFPAVSGILYASHGPIKQRTLGNGLTETMTWDPTRLQQTALSATLNGSNLLALNYYYCTGNAASCTTKSAWDAVPGSQTNYFYLRGKALNWAENNVGSSAAFWPYGQPLGGGGNGVFATYRRTRRDSCTRISGTTTSLGGRFVTADPSNHRRGLRSSGAWNKYSYSLGDPINRNDRHGKCSDMVAGITEQPLTYDGAGQITASGVYALATQLGAVSAFPYSGIDIANSVLLVDDQSLIGFYGVGNQQSGTAGMATQFAISQSPTGTISLYYFSGGPSLAILRLTP